MNEMFLNEQTSKVLKELLNKKNNKFGGKDIPEDEYKNIKEEIKELTEKSFIKITWLPQPYQKENHIYRIQITSKGRNYFDIKQHNNLEYWIPILISWGLSITAIVISIVK